MAATRRFPLRLGAVAVALSVLALTGCGAGGSSGGGAAPAKGYTPGSLSKAYKGQQITVLLPPWGQLKPSLLADFTKQTGVKVKMQSLAWDSIHDKVVTTEAAGQAPADVVELDWTWVSQFGKAGWFTDLGQYLTKQQISDSIGADAFVQGGKQIGLPYTLDFRGSVVDMTMLKKAGISSPPKNWSDLVAAAEAVKAKGIVKYPIGLPLAVLEGTSTPWYALTRASGGQILSKTGAPEFANGSAATDALALIHTLYSKQLVDPGSIGLSDQQVGDAYAGGANAIVLSNGPGSLSQFLDKGKSKIAGDELVFTHIPGEKDDQGPTIGLEEALSIPKQSAHKEAAAMFITWWMKTPQLVAAYKDPDLGLLPTTKAGLTALSSSHDLKSADTILQMVGTVQAVVPGGTPTWYSKFSTAAASTIQSVALGHTTPQAGISSLTAQAKKIAAQ
jgi:multiple sugar transport system substrate-binding protein